MCQTRPNVAIDILIQSFEKSANMEPDQKTRATGRRIFPKVFRQALLSLLTFHRAQSSL